MRKGIGRETASEQRVVRWTGTITDLDLGCRNENEHQRWVLGPDASNHSGGLCNRAVSLGVLHSNLAKVLGAV